MDLTKKDNLSVTCTAPVNIAVVKYWGKRDEKLILPINGSISCTLDQQQLRTKTTIVASSQFTDTRMTLNGREESVEGSRFNNVLREIRKRARGQCNRTGQRCVTEDVLNWHIHIASENNFPTAAGLASSAAGLACLVYSLAKLYGVEDDISDIARQGSGSACRSVFGGFVEWVMGTDADGSDSVAKQIVPETYWPDVHILILVVSAKKKQTASTSGMQTSVETSELLSYRAQHIVPNSLTEMKQAILEKNFEQFAQLTMKDSNQLHAVCLDTYPPIVYMSDTSHDIVRLVHGVNKFYGVNKVAYTFDAGPNACLYVLERDVPVVLGTICHFFATTNTDHSFLTGIKTDISSPSQELMESISLTPRPDSLQYIIHTKVGSGPQQVTDPSDALLTSDGLTAV